MNHVLTFLNRFIPNSAQHVLLLYMLLRKKDGFEWTSYCKEAFKSLRKPMVMPLVLTRPLMGDTLYLYATVIEEAVSSLIVRKEYVGHEDAPSS